ncbi:uncharacterized protein PHALS_00630 [Plasmopara halstedii]|uniref:Uncharacterized protein n=1 Tax=Plasmopara halstedii TaxID=4781 RepID=A0A0P1B8J2_PLAHL|nr:uncharacterized protein PHALS_00630 [Plasmopara halstedii]CEG50487.1 hypothetical protein PHALS_00630 [Plasmopara halstedii]|eukprot:XP_024586856.1 hypothetical protein PHALS_00630 [Plasmopara halstedii]
MFNFYAYEASQHSKEVSEIEQYRAHHRRICRGIQPDSALNQTKDFDVDDGRARKMSARCRRQQQQIPVSNQFSDNDEMHATFNAFDFSASPEAFNEILQPFEGQAAGLSCQGGQQLDGAMSNNSSLWERRFPDHRKSETSVRQLPKLGKDALWGGHVHYATHDAQRQASYNQPQYFA